MAESCHMALPAGPDFNGLLYYRLHYDLGVLQPSVSFWW